MPIVKIIFRVMILFLLLTAACSSPKPIPEATETGGGSSASGQISASNQTTEKEYEDFDPNNFDQSTNIDNKWFPLKPGAQFTYEGTTVEDGESVPHRLIITVTDLTKVINGVRSVVTWDRDFSAEELVEAELAFFAQDKDGHVWRMGEYPEEYENGKLVAAPTWIHGFQDAHAGIAMPSSPKMGTPSFAEGWGPAVDWNDRGQVDKIGLEICVPTNCYKDVLVIAETSKSEQGAFQLKYYAPGVGNVLTDWKGSDQSQEKLELVEWLELDATQLSDVRAGALELEKSAYKVSRMYAQTLPMENPDGTPTVSIAATEISPTSSASEPATEIVVYAADLPSATLFELEFWDDPASPGGKLIGIPNNGDELDPPPENDPHVTLDVKVQSGISYRCWIHMKVGDPKGKSLANVIWVQFSNAVGQNNEPIFNPGSSSYLTAQGPRVPGWAWVGCDLQGQKSLLTFQPAGVTTIRLQAGMEGVAFDQFVLSSAKFLDVPPTTSIVEK